MPEIDIRGGLGPGGVPAFEFNRSDGLNIISADPMLGEWKFPPGYLTAELRLRPGSLQIIEVQGDSMEPTLRSGDRVMVDLSHRSPSPLGIYALWDGLGVIVKRLEYLGGDPPLIAVTSDNPGHERRKLTADEVNIIGRVVWFARRL
ncbi:MAG TPA: S24 family peptidase [Beijerinckiaceae bacterium]|nr:S24 family peptidase [Beijerinckiaceae bacterium]